MVLMKSTMLAKGLAPPSEEVPSEEMKFIMPVGVAMSDGRVCMKVLRAARRWEEGESSKDKREDY